MLILFLAFLVFLTVNESTQAYSPHGWRFFKCSTCSTSYPTYSWGDRLTGSSVIKTGWQNAITSWHGKQSKVRFTYSSGSTSKLNSWYETSSTYYGRMYTSYDAFKFVTKFTGELNAGNTNITKTNVAQSSGVHELGHAMGIDHVSGTSIMNTSRDRTRIYTPQTDDVNGINAIY
ncbi:peptidase [Bacillus sp. V3-13]|nr:peptidase [Bacillus sp. V3-13]